GVTEYREPEEGEEGGYQHHTEDELADGATTADLGDEQADKGCPGDGPAEDEQGPVADPVTARVGLQVEGPLDDVVQVAAGVLQEGLENEDGRADQEDEQHQRGGDDHVQHRQALDALVHARHHRAHGQHRDAGNTRDLHPGIDRYRRPQVVEPGIHLRHGKAQGSGNAEHGAENGEDIHCVTDGAIDAVTDQRVERRADGQRQAVAEGEVRQHQTGQPVDGPDVKAPVEEGDLHGLLGRIHCQSRTDRRVGIMQHGFGDAEEQQGDTVAGGEQHGEPGREAVLGFGVVRPELDVAPAAQGDYHHKDQEYRHGQHVEPAEAAGDIGQQRGKQLPGQVRLTGGTYDQQQDEEERRYEHRQQNG